MTPTVAAVAVDGGDLPLGGGLLALVRPALGLLEPGGVLSLFGKKPDVDTMRMSELRSRLEEIQRSIAELKRPAV